MTGFARSSRALAGGDLTITVKAVNHRGLDVQFHHPPEFDALDGALRNLVRGQVSRGHLHVTIEWNRQAAAEAIAVDQALVEGYVSIFRETAARLGLDGSPDLNVVLSLPGVLRPASQTALAADLEGAVMALAGDVLAEFNAFRAREGAALAAEIAGRSREVRARVEAIEAIRENALPAFAARLESRIAELVGAAGLEPQRLAQEAALLADRTDVSEELMRLGVHAGQLDALLAAGGEIGRKLDFLLQEMNREINTTLSKSAGIGEFGLEITDHALAAKAEIEKMREQVLNLE